MCDSDSDEVCEFSLIVHFLNIVLCLSGKAFFPSYFIGHRLNAFGIGLDASVVYLAVLAWIQIAIYK